MAKLSTPNTWEEIFNIQAPRPYGFPFQIEKQDENELDFVQLVPRGEKDLFVSQVYGWSDVNPNEYIHVVKMTPPLVVAKSTPNADQNNPGFNLFVKSFIVVRIPGATYDEGSDNVASFMSSINIYMKPHWEGMVFNPQFVFESRIPEPETEVNAVSEEGHLYAFRIQFTVENIPVHANAVTAYLWDTDPEGTRGTTTTVQSGTGGN